MSPAPSKPRRLLFVCSGNICRSPLAEAAFVLLAERAGRAADFEVDSAGTHGWHEGEPADPRARRVGQRHGAKVTSIARAVVDADFEEFDLILAMDRGHLRELRSRCPPPHREKIRLMRDYEPAPSPDGSAGLDVPDPYYDGEPAFENVYLIVERCSRRLLEDLAG
jgi:protein-tyrosine phosphatase